MTNRMPRFVLLYCSMSLAMGSMALAKQPGDTVKKIKKDGVLPVAVRLGDVKGFAFHDENGVRRGLEIDLARAVAAAIFGSADVTEIDRHIAYVETSSTTRWTALLVEPEAVDLVIRSATNTLTRDDFQSAFGAGAEFGPTYFYDGADVLLRDNDRVCPNPRSSNTLIVVIEGTTSEAALRSAIAHYAPLDPVVATWEPKPVKSEGEAVDLFLNGCVDGFASDTSALIGFSLRSTNPLTGVRYFATSYHTLISKEPLAPVVREGDVKWADAVRWVLYALIEAEERGITQDTVTTDFGAGLGPELGLADHWAYHVIKAGGNYGEIFRRNLKEPEWQPRGFNELWIHGGLLYSPPLR